MQAEIELGDGLSDIRSTKQCLEALKKAGFEVSINLLSSFTELFFFFAFYGKINNLIYPLFKRKQ